MTECCGNELTSPFCPQCGKEAGREPSWKTLLEHCAANLEKATKRLKTTSDNLSLLEQGTRESYEGQLERTRVWLKRAEHSRAKWLKWHQLVAAVINERG